MIFIDMDGTLAKFYEKPDYLERMYERGFFRNLKPYATVKYFNKLIEHGEQVFILSACIDSPYCKEEKEQWLREYMPKLRKENYIFVNIGESKVKRAYEYMQKHSLSCTQATLLDDYSENLHNWCLPYSGVNFIPIKFCNGINNKTGKQYCHKVKTIKQLNSLLKQLNEIK